MDIKKDHLKRKETSISPAKENPTTNTAAKRSSAANWEHSKEAIIIRGIKLVGVAVLKI